MVTTYHANIYFFCTIGNNTIITYIFYAIWQCTLWKPHNTLQICLNKPLKTGMQAKYIKHCKAVKCQYSAHQKLETMDDTKVHASVLQEIELWPSEDSKMTSLIHIWVTQRNMFRCRIMLVGVYDHTDSDNKLTKSLFTYSYPYRPQIIQNYMTAGCACLKDF